MKKYKIHFAPVQGLTDWTLRNLHAKFFGGVDAYYTPFIRVEKEDSFRSRDMKDCDPELNSVELLVPQVLGGEPAELDVCLQMLEGRGYKQVDINMGCPFTMISRRGKGAGLLPHPERVEALMEVVKDFPEIREDAVRMGRSGGMFEIIAFVECGPVGSYISPCPGWSAGIQGGDGQGGFRGVLQGV